MSVITRPRLPHLRSGPPTTAVPGQRRSDELRPWSPRRQAPDDTTAPRNRGLALMLAGVGVAGAAGIGLAVAAPWEDGATTIQAPAGSVVRSTDQARDDALARRNPARAGTGADGAGTAGAPSIDSADVLNSEKRIRLGGR